MDSVTGYAECGDSFTGRQARGLAEQNPRAGSRLYSCEWLALSHGSLLARPTARMSRKVAVISPFDAVPTLMIRVANLRHEAIVESKFRMVLLRNI